MNEMSGLSQIVELFDLRLSLCDAAWEDYLASHPELPHRFVTQALLLFQAHGADIQAKVPAIQAELDRRHAAPWRTTRGPVYVGVRSSR